MDWFGLLAFVFQLIFVVALWFTRHWWLAWINRSVQHGFDTRLEQLRSELRGSEERVKSELRDNEAEIGALRNAVLSGSANRQSLLDKRRFEAVEKIWFAVNELGKYKMQSGMMAALNLKALAKQLTRSEMQQFCKILEDTAPPLKEYKDGARDEQPFVSELAWAYYSAYRATMIT